MLFTLLLVSIVDARTVAIKLNNDADPVEYALQYGLEYVDSVHDWYIFRQHYTPRGSNAFLEDSSVMAFEDQQERQQRTRSSYLGTDPLYNAQWHLHGNQYGVDVEQTDQTGRGVKIAIVDDGLQHSHSDLHQNYSPLLSYDFNDHDMDPDANVYNNDGHGSSAAGVCCATKHNNHCGQGVAPEATLVGIRLIARGTYDYEEAQGLSHKTDQIDIYSCSWGPEDNARDLVGPGRVTREALTRNFNSGSIYVWAGGNGRNDGDNGNYDGYANHYTTIAIGALDADGDQSWYSEDCACLFAVAPSSGARGYGKGIVTTDLTGPYGYSSGECTRNFGGTSSAAPLAAGIVAILKQKRPELTNRDIMHVIAKGSTRVDVSNPDWSIRLDNKYSHSHHYGFGLLKIPKLIETAVSHRLVPPMQTIHSTTLYTSSVITQSSYTSVNVVHELSFIEHVLCEVSYHHPHRGNIRLELEHNGVRSILQEKHRDNHYGLTTWTYSSVRHWGQSNERNGQWTLYVTDSDSSTSGRGRLNSIKITLLGY